MGKTYYYKGHALPKYSDEQYKAWAEAAEKGRQFTLNHSKEIEKWYKVNDLFILCIQRTFDDVYKKYNPHTKDEYGIQVWNRRDRNLLADPSACLFNEWFDSKEEANDYFKIMIEYCRS